MRKLLGYSLFGLGILIFWPAQIGLGIFGIYYIVKMFLDAGIVAGLITIPIVGVSLGIIHLILGAIAIPLAGLAARLLENERGKRVEDKGFYYPEKVDINTADAWLLETLPGIGLDKALNIINYRSENGPFLHKEDLMCVDGIGRKTYESLQDKITIGAISLPSIEPQTQHFYRKPSGRTKRSDDRGE